MRFRQYIYYTYSQTFSNSPLQKLQPFLSQPEIEGTSYGWSMRGGEYFSDGDMTGYRDYTSQEKVGGMMVLATPDFGSFWPKIIALCYHTKL